MPSNNSKYSEEMREQTARHILESGKSATRVAEELGIDTNTVCRWVRDYRRRNNLPSYAESQSVSRSKRAGDHDLAEELKEAERKLKQQEKLLADEREKVEILKKSLHIFMQAPE